MYKKSIDTRALELACEELLKRIYYGVAMTMYPGKWERMIEEHCNKYRKLAKEKKR